MITKGELSLEETEALLYGERIANGVVHNQRVFEVYEPGVRLESKD